jgi:hypothetical protein
MQDFPNRGKYRVYDRAWNRAGCSDAPQYAGQQPIRFPEEWPPARCFLEGVRE